MVKPEYPKRQGTQPQVSLSYNGAVGDEAGIIYEGDNWSTVTDDSVFVPSGSHLPSYSRSISCPVPSSVPRERISSLPSPEDQGQTGPSPQRRGSTPVNMHFHSGQASGSARPEVQNELPPELQDIALKGQELFWFVFNKVVKGDENAASGSSSALTIMPQRMEVLNERGRSGGPTLQQIAEAFFHSPLRRTVWEHANRIDIQALDYDSFSFILLGLFQEGGITQTRVMVLIFFCVDLAHRAFKEKLLNLFQELIKWTSTFITDRLSAWVMEHGGWAAVLQESVDNRVAIVGLCLLTAVVLSVWLLKR